MKKDRAKNGNVMFVGLIGILLMAMMFIHFQRILMYQLEKADAMSLAENSTLLYYYDIKIGRKELNSLKKSYSGLLNKGKMNFQIKDNFMGVQSVVKINLPYLKRTVKEEFKITAPGRIKW